MVFLVDQEGGGHSEEMRYFMPCSDFHNRHRDRTVPVEASHADLVAADGFLICRRGFLGV